VADKPEIAPGEWISIGKKSPRIRAVVCTVYNEPPFDCEVVYLDNRDRAGEMGCYALGFCFSRYIRGIR